MKSRASSLLYCLVAISSVLFVNAQSACTDCNDLNPRLEQFCQDIVKEGQPCSSYRLVWRRLCRRTCLAVNRMGCRDQLAVCQEDPDCPMLCKLFFDQLCPTTMLPPEPGKPSFLEIAERSWEFNRLWVKSQTKVTASEKRLRRAVLEPQSQTGAGQRDLTLGQGDAVTGPTALDDADIASNIEYTVKPGDWLSKIAPRYGSSVDLIVAANPQIKNPDLIYPGQVIRIPIPKKVLKAQEDPCPGTPLN